MSTKLYALLVCVMTFCTGMAVPAAVEEHGGSIIKTYELAPEESPQLLIEEPFERDGFLYKYDGLTQEPVSKTESKSVSQTVTVESGSAKTEENLALLAGSIPYEADGYTGTLTLLPASIHTEAKGYATRSYTVSDTRTYTNLAYNDPSLIPQAVEKNGLTLALTGVTWHGEGGTGANGSLIPTSYTATASYSGTGSTRYATGYLTTADYAGTVTKTVTEKILYEVEYRGTPIPEPEPEPQEENPSLPLWIPIGAGAVLLGGGTAGAVLAVRKRRNLTR